jgi:DNA polymerase-3 subunit beta
VIFRAGPVTIHSRLVEGRFPKYQDVIPRDAKITVEMTAAPFYAAVRQAQIVTDEDSRGVDFRFGPGLLTMTSRARNIGESTVELPIGFHGPEIGITFDPQFVADFLRVLEPEQTLRIELVDSESAAVFRTDDGYTYIVMPLSRDR